MKKTVNDKIPNETVYILGNQGPEAIALSDHCAGKKVVIFALPGAYTPTCHSAHVPSFIASKDELAAKGIDEIICLSVNDPFVMGAWGRETGATDAGILMAGDALGAFTKEMGMNFDAPPAGLMGRSNRYAMVVNDGVIEILQEDAPGACAMSTGNGILDAL
ncbi:MAG: peroxiredoxin [Halocynthiibacter sp.]